MAKAEIYELNDGRAKEPVEAGEAVTVDDRPAPDTLQSTAQPVEDTSAVAASPIQPTGAARLGVGGRYILDGAGRRVRAPNN